MADVMISEWPSPTATREAELPIGDEESVDTTFPLATEYIRTDEPTTEKK